MFKVCHSTCAPHLQTHLLISKLALHSDQQVDFWLMCGHLAGFWSPWQLLKIVLSKMEHVGHSE